MFAPNVCDTEMRVAGNVKRIGADLPYVHESTFNDIGRFVNKVFIPFFYPDVTGFKLMTVGEWLDTRDFDLAKKARFMKYYNEWVESGRKPKRSDIVVDTHTKLEFYPEAKFYRGIFSRSDRFKAAYGPLVSSIEKIAYKILPFIKNVPVVERAAFINKLFQNLRVYLNDCTAFESSSHPSLMRNVLLPIYQHCSNHEYDEYVSDYIEALCGINKIKCSDYKMLVNGRRMSGEMDTSLGNGLINLVIICYVFWKKGGSLSDLLIIIEGDDSLFHHLGGIEVNSDDFRKLGFNAKLESSAHVSDASFCGLIYHEDDLINIANPMTILMKLGWADARYANYPDRIKLELYKSKITCMIVQYYKTPIIYPYCLSMYKQLSKSRVKTDNYWDQQVVKQIGTVDVSKEYPIPIGTRQKMADSFGIPIHDQIRIEDQLRSLKVGENIPNAYLDNYILPIYKENFYNNVCKVFKNSSIGLSECGRSLNPKPVPKSWMFGELGLCPDKLSGDEFVTHPYYYGLDIPRSA